MLFTLDNPRPQRPEHPTLHGDRERSEKLPRFKQHNKYMDPAIESRDDVTLFSTACKPCNSQGDHFMATASLRAALHHRAAVCTRRAAEALSRYNTTGPRWDVATKFCFKSAAGCGWLMRVDFRQAKMTDRQDSRSAQRSCPKGWAHGCAQ